MEHEKDMPKTANDEGEEFPCDGLVMVGASWIIKDLHHESGFLAHDPITYIEAGGRRILVTDDSDVPRARASSRADEVWSENEFDLRDEAARRGSRHAARLELTVRAVRRAGLDAVVVPDWFPAAYADHLRASGVSVRVDSSALDARRRRKTPDEIRAMTNTLRVAESSLGDVRTLLGQASEVDGVLMLDGEPLTSARVQRHVHVLWAGAGCEGETPTIACGPDSAFIYEPGQGPLHARQPILCDLWPREMRGHYHSDITRVFCVGEPSHELQAAHTVVREALELLRAACRPGVCGRDLYRDVCDLAWQRGVFSTLHPDPGGQPGEKLTLAPFLGHGIGLDIHEESSGPHPFIAVPMQPGDVMTLEPTVYRDGWGGVRLEDMIVITDEGCETLTCFDYDLTVQ